MDSSPVSHSVTLMNSRGTAVTQSYTIVWSQMGHWELRLDSSFALLNPASSRLRTAATAYARSPQPGGGARQTRAASRFAAQLGHSFHMKAGSAAQHSARPARRPVAGCSAPGGGVPCPPGAMCTGGKSAHSRHGLADSVPARGRCSVCPAGALHRRSAEPYRGRLHYFVRDVRNQHRRRKARNRNCAPGFSW